MYVCGFAMDPGVESCVYVRVCACMYVCDDLIVHANVHTCTHVYFMYLYVLKNTYAYVLIYMCVYHTFHACLINVYISNIV
jgi:hypothetical protein